MLTTTASQQQHQHQQQQRSSSSRLQVIGGSSRGGRLVVAGGSGVHNGDVIIEEEQLVRKNINFHIRKHPHPAVATTTNNNMSTYYVEDAANLLVPNSVLEISTIGPNRSRPNEYDAPSFSSLQETTALVIEDLLDDSHFFNENLPRVMGTFDQTEVDCGAVLGTGEFGIVYEITNLKLTEKANPTLTTKNSTKTTTTNAANTNTSTSVSTCTAPDDATAADDDKNNNNMLMTTGRGNNHLPPLSPAFPPRSILVRAKPPTTNTATSQQGDNDSKEEEKDRHDCTAEEEVTPTGSVLTQPELPSLEDGTAASALDITASHHNRSTSTTPTVSSSHHRRDVRVTQQQPNPQPPRHRRNTSVTFADTSVAGVGGGGGGTIGGGGASKTTISDVMDEIFSDNDGDYEDDFYDDDDHIVFDLSATGEGNSPGDLACQVQQLRKRMSVYVRSRGGGGVISGTPRYALKRLKNNCLVQTDAAIDLACEARFLASIHHPNIVRLRGTVGSPGTPRFAIILDRLTEILVERMSEWKSELKILRGGFLGFGLLCRDTTVVAKIFADRLLAAYDIARAMRYLHSKKIVYRDLKPENIGFDVHGEVRIFDFGLAKELKERDRVYGAGATSSECYHATGLTGSRRYMAPECVKCLPYGFSADVYSYSILLWEILALETPFAHYDAAKHFDLVVVQGKRPPRKSSVPASWQAVLEDGWAEDPSRRPPFFAICGLLQEELDTLAGKQSDTIDNRTYFLTQRSLNSYQYGLE